MEHCGLPGKKESSVKRVISESLLIKIWNMPWKYDKDVTN